MPAASQLIVAIAAVAAIALAVLLEVSSSLPTRDLPPDPFRSRTATVDEVRADVAGAMVGTWVLLTSSSDSRLKVFTGYEWFVVETDTLTGDVVRHVGGTYVVSGRTAMAVVSYADALSMDRPGTRHEFDVQVDAGGYRETFADGTVVHYRRASFDDPAVQRASDAGFALGRLAGAPAPGSAAIEAQPLRIAGRVVESGTDRGVGRAVVRLLAVEPSRQPPWLQATADEAGVFVFARVPTGRYELEAGKAGFRLPDDATVGVEVAGTRERVDEGGRQVRIETMLRLEDVTLRLDAVGPTGGS